MSHRIEWAWIWLGGFGRNLWHRTWYAPLRCTLSDAAFIARTVADTCMSIRRETREVQS